MVPPLNTLVATGNNYKISYFQDQDWYESDPVGTHERARSALGAGSQRPTDARCTEEVGLNNQAVKWGNNEDVGPP